METSPSTDARPIWVGAHSVIIEPDRSMTITFHGNCTAEHAEQFVELIQAHGRNGAFGILMDAADLGDVNGDARAHWIRVSRPYPFVRLLVYAPVFAKKILVGTLYRAGRVLLPQYFQWELIFVSTAEEGRSLLKSKP